VRWRTDESAQGAYAGVSEKAHAHEERSVIAMLTAHETDAHSAGKIEPLTACFGVACFARHHCARYAAVSRSQASPTTLGTCLNGKAYPLFVTITESERQPRERTILSRHIDVATNR
jgi:hypothetical protein